MSDALHDAITAYTEDVLRAARYKEDSEIERVKARGIDTLLDALRDEFHGRINDEDREIRRRIQALERRGGETYP